MFRPFLIFDSCVVSVVDSFAVLLGRILPLDILIEFQHVVAWHLRPLAMISGGPYHCPFTFWHPLGLLAL